MKYIFLFSSILFFTLFNVVSAHVKWFVNSKSVIGSYHDQIPFYYLDSDEVFLWSLISLVVIFIFAVLDKVIKNPHKLEVYAERNKKTINRIAEILVGVFLITVSIIWKLILIPEFPLTYDFWTVMLLLSQIFIGFLLVFGQSVRVASVMLILLVSIVTLKIGTVALLENLLLIGLAIYIYINNTKDVKQFWLDHSVEILRVSTGVSLIVLAFSEKLMYPELSLSFLSTYDWNFMQNFFGLDFFSNNLFVLSAGFAELIFGIIFMLGYLTRINTLFIALFFGLSVITMLLKYGAWEVEDLPVYSAAVIFLFFGSGKQKILEKISLRKLFKLTN